MSAADVQEPRPPVFKNWGGWYKLLLGFTVVQFVVYYVLTQILNKP